MTIKSKLTFLSLLVAVLATSFAAVSTYADEGEIHQKFQKAHEAMNSGDYDTVAEMYENHTGNELSEDQFNVMQEAQTLMQEGDKEGAKALFEEAGIELPKMHKFKKMKEKKGEFFENLTDEQKEVLEQARELKQEGDVEGAKELLAESGIKLPPKKHFDKNCGFGTGFEKGERSE